MREYARDFCRLLYTNEIENPLLPSFTEEEIP